MVHLGDLLLLFKCFITVDPRNTGGKEVVFKSMKYFTRLAVTDKIYSSIVLMGMRCRNFP